MGHFSGKALQREKREIVSWVIHSHFNQADVKLLVFYEENTFGNLTWNYNRNCEFQSRMPCFFEHPSCCWRPNRLWWFLFHTRSTWSSHLHGPWWHNFLYTFPSSVTSEVDFWAESGWRVTQRWKVRCDTGTCWS
jgi:hypothetical protein